MEIPGFKVSRADANRLATPLELDLVAYFNVALDAVSEKMEKAVVEGWTPEQMIAEIDMLFDGTADRISYADEFVQKGQGLPAGARRFWPSDGHWHIKQKDGAWLDEYDGHMSKPGANAGHRHQLNSAGGGNEKDPQRALGQAGKEPEEPEAQVASEPKAEEPKVKNPRAKKQAKLYEGKEWKHLEIRDKNRLDPDRLKAELKAEYKKKHGLDSNDLNIQRIDRLPDHDIEYMANKFAKLRKKPMEVGDEDWAKMPFVDRVNANKKRMIEELAQARYGNNPNPGPHELRRIRQFKRQLNHSDAAGIAEYGKQYLGKDPGSKPTADLPQPKNHIADKDWKAMGYHERAREDRPRLIHEILDAREANGGPKKAGELKKFHKKSDDELANYAHRYLGEGASTEKRSAARVAYEKAEKERKQKEKDEQNRRFAELVKEAVTQEHHYVVKAKEEPLIKADPEVAKAKLLGHGHINAVYGIPFKTPSGKDEKLVFKPQAEEYAQDVRRGNIPPKTQWIRERLGYEVNAIVGLDNAPVAVVRDVPGMGIGAALNNLEAEDWDGAGLGFQDVPRDEMKKLALHHFLVCNTDGHGRNLMVNKAQKKIYAIDSGLAFPENEEYGNFQGYRNWAHKNLENLGDLDLPDDIKNLVTEEKKKKVLEKIDQYKFPKFTRDLIEKRFDYVIKNGRLPGVDWDDDGFAEKVRY